MAGTPFQADGTFGSPPQDGAGFAGEANAASQGGTGNPYIDGVLSGNRWTGSLTFSFPQLASQYAASYAASEPASNFAPISLQQQNEARAILTGTTVGAVANVLTYDSVKDFTNLVIGEANGLGKGIDGSGDLRLAQSSIPSTAYAYYPSNASDGVGGDVWFGTAYAGTSNDYRNPILGNYAYQSLEHEIGHALGLKHGQEAGGPANVAVPDDRDGLEFTTMSYRAYIGDTTSSGYGYEQFGAPQSYMMLDILALQTMYGADYGYHAGDTTYRWDPATGQMFVREGSGAFIGQGTPGADRVFLTTWDGGGTDTYDLSNYTSAVSIDLRPGQWSVTSSAQRAYLGDGHYAQGNVYNAYLFNNNTASLIENAIGTSGNDTIVGNQAANVLIGGFGADTLTGGAGADSFRGTAADLNHDTITDMANEDMITVTDAVGQVYGLAYANGAVSFQLSPTASQVYSVALAGSFGSTVSQRVSASGGVDIVFGGSQAASVAINDVSIIEGDAGTSVATFTVTRSGGSAAFTVTYATANGTATAGSDYVAAAGTLSFAAGVMSQTVAVTINGDTAIEPNETFFVNLSGATNGAVLGHGQGVGTILTDDVRDDFAGSLTDTGVPFGVVAAGGAATGEIEVAGDRDWFRVQLAAGARYVVDLSGFDSNAGSLANPYLRLHDASGAIVGQNDDGGPGLDGQLIFTAATSGTYYIEAAAAGDNAAGTYRVAVSGDVTPDPDGMPLVDDRFYYGHNPDVAAAHVDPEAHYNANGWHEGRDPNPFFSTTGYLAANADVRAAGLNPLSHYDANGWHEGRDPAANFDNELYLARNPDVAKAGLDPLAHYLANGAAEGRQAYAAIGRGSDITKAHGFDAEYYLLNNSDVARAAIKAGGDSFAFAYQHYESNGWHEGRNPNAVFDVKGYLDAYADVRAANIDPLAHYDANGWHEGRDPAANFDTKAYEAHYGDVAAAHVDPLIHYLTNGIYEGRSAFADGHLG